MSPKQKLRREVEKLRKTLRPEERSTMSSQIVSRFESQEFFQSANTVSLYMPVPGEVNLNALFETCWSHGKRTCIPTFNKTSAIYEMSEIFENTEYRTGRYGIKEPCAPIRTSINSIDLIIVPGVAFDRLGHRLGRGGGYYDRLLDGFFGFSAAVAFGFQLLQQIPYDAHDRPVQAIVTNSGVINVS